MRALVAQFIRETGGTTAIEYGLIMALIASVMISGLREVGSNLNSQLIAIGPSLNQAPAQ